MESFPETQPDPLQHYESYNHQLVLTNSRSEAVSIIPQLFWECLHLRGQNCGSLWNESLGCGPRSQEQILPSLWVQGQKGKGSALGPAKLLGHEHHSQAEGVKPHKRLGLDCQTLPGATHNLNSNQASEDPTSPSHRVTHVEHPPGSSHLAPRLFRRKPAARPRPLTQLRRCCCANQVLGS